MAFTTQIKSQLTSTTGLNNEPTNDMSIKGFHLIFIAIAALFCAGFGVWALFLDDHANGVGTKIFGGVTLAASVALVVYGFYFRRKSKDIIV